MALRDTVSGISSVATTAYLDIRPSSTAEWVIHNIYHEAEVELYFYDGTNNLLFDTASEAGVYAAHDFHCTNTRRIQVKNTNAGAKLIAYDGVITHV